MIYQVGKLRLSFFYEGDELDYIAEFGDDDTLYVDVQPGKYDAHDVSEAISRELNNETLTLSETERAHINTLKTQYEEKYIPQNLRMNNMKVFRGNNMIIPPFPQLPYPNLPPKEGKKEPKLKYIDA